MPREELRERALGPLPSDVSRATLDRLGVRGAIVERRDATVHLAGHQVTLTDEEERAREQLEAAFVRDELNPPDLADVIQAHRLESRRADRLVALLLSEGRLVRLGDGRLYATEAVERLKRKLWDLRQERPVIDIGFFKEMTGTSRKNAIPLLEYLDAVKVTRRRGSDREILPPPGG
jgi:selenocysteine-specific elongation factor